MTKMTFFEGDMFETEVFHVIAKYRIGPHRLYAVFRTFECGSIRSFHWGFWIDFFPSSIPVNSRVIMFRLSWFHYNIQSNAKMFSAT